MLKSSSLSFEIERSARSDDHGQKKNDTFPPSFTFGWIEEDVRLRDSPKRPSGALI